MQYLTMYMLTAIVAVMTCVFPVHAAPDRADCGDAGDRWETVKASLPEYVRDGIDRTGDAGLTAEEKEYLAFLYSAMPLPDMTGYSFGYWVDNVRKALEVRRNAGWKIPEREFRHFVLPVRVNNEALDDFRTIYADDLCARVKGMTIEEAALEINHWCHEMATYAPSDARTLPPTGTIAGGLGRCGEESVLAVAALRAAGIPARQVYTPRWAHTDDNHAWVEVFVDGGWHFMGACEPEPVLNLAWFNAPVSRAMLLHTLAFGDYSGPEDVIRRTHSFTEINVIKSYIPTRRTSVKVLDGQGFPVAGATVEFKIYNYAEFYTVAKTVTGVDGMAGLDTGIGDMLVWAHKDGRFGIAKASGEMTEIVLDRREGEEFGLDFDIVPPVENPIPSTATEEQVRLNALRLAYEDSVRTARPKGNAAVLAFRETYRIREGCAENMCDAGALLASLSDKDMVDVRADVLEDAMAHCGEGFRPYRDCPRISYEPLLPYFGEIRQGLMACARKGSTSAGAVRREAGHAAGKHGTAGQGSLDWTPEHIMDWTLANIEVCDSLNPQGIYIPPVTVWRSRISDSRSRDIFFVAACRSMGFEARIDEVTGKTQYRDPVRCVLEGTGKNGMIQSPDVCGCTVEGTDRGDSKLQPQDCGRWVDVVWPENDADSGAAGKGDKSGKKDKTDGTDSAGTACKTGHDDKADSDARENDATAMASMGYVKSTYTPVSWLKDPLYYRHFTLSRIDRGSARLLAFDENGDAGWKELLSEPYPAETGYYLLTSGIRMADGTVSAHLEFFNVNKDRETTVPLVLRQQEGTIAVIGNINAEETFLPEGGREEQTILSVTGRGYFAMALIKDFSEPSIHALRQLGATADALDGWGRCIVVLGADDEGCGRMKEYLTGIDKVQYGTDPDGKIQKMVYDGCMKENGRLPVVIIADSFGRVVYYSQGYNTSLSEQLRSVISRL